MKEYEILFREYFLKSFSSRLSEYSDPKINVLTQEILNKKYTMVSTVLVANEKRPEVKIAVWLFCARLLHAHKTPAQDRTRL